MSEATANDIAKTNKLGLVGQKIGMTQVFTDEGVSIPVTVIHCDDNRVTQIKTKETDGYNAVQVTTGTRRASRVTKPMAGHFAKANTEAGRGMWEFRVSDAAEANHHEIVPGAGITVEIFDEGQVVDVVGTSKGKGFAGVIKRHNFSMQDATHGNSLAHRAAGSIGQNQSPGKVFKGKKMAGQMGNVRKTVQNQRIVRVDAERKLILVRGAVPGAPGSDVIIKPAVKSAEEEKA